MGIFHSYVSLAEGKVLLSMIIWSIYDQETCCFVTDEISYQAGTSMFSEFIQPASHPPLHPPLQHDSKLVNMVTVRSFSYQRDMFQVYQSGLQLFLKYSISLVYTCWYKWYNYSQWYWLRRVWYYEIWKTCESSGFSAMIHPAAFGLCNHIVAGFNLQHSWDHWVARFVDVGLPQSQKCRFDCDEKTNTYKII